MSSITGTVNGIVNPSFTYDANGNLTAGLGRTLTWTSYNQMATVTRGSTTLSFTHDSDHRRIKQYVSTTQETTIYINAQVRSEKLLNNSGGLIRWNNYIYAAGAMIAVFYDNASSADQTRYFHKDHLGSIAVITDESGTVVERLNYDAWGKRRFSNGADDPNETVGSLTDRGYTGHEHLQEVALIHMNGRIYDPLLGRFMSADPYVQDPFDTQSLNRYSYVKNNPLAYTDPSGYFFKSIFRAVQSFFQSNPVLAVVAGVAAAVLTGGISLTATGINITLAGAYTAGGVSGLLTGGIKGAIVGGLSGAATFGIGDIGLGLGQAEFLVKAGMHGVVQGTAAEVQGGKFGNAFAAGTFSSIGGSVIGAPTNVETLVAKTVATAVVGGVASTIGGGKFQNGAATGAFVYLLNHATHASLDRPVSAHQEGKNVVYVYSDGRMEVREGGTVSWRTNNPGNIEHGRFALRHGAIGRYEAFAIFPTEAVGTGALNALLHTPSYQSRTIDAVIERYAPPAANDTAGYQRFVSGRLGVSGNTPLNSLSPAQMGILQNAIRTFEGWRPGNTLSVGGVDG